MNKTEMPPALWAKVDDKGDVCVFDFNPNEKGFTRYRRVDPAPPSEPPPIDQVTRSTAKDYGDTEGYLTEEDLDEFSEAEARVVNFMWGRGWVPAQQIIDVANQRTGLRRLRQLRKKGFVVEKKKGENGGREWLYRLSLAEKQVDQPELF